MTGLRKFRKFCFDYHSRVVDVKSVLLFIASLFHQKVASSTIHVYLSAMNNSLRKHGLLSLDDKFILSCALEGYSRFFPRQVDQRRPLSMSIMTHIKSTLRHSSLPPGVQRLYWCACCFAFFGYFRASEFTTTSHSSFHSPQQPHIPQHHNEG
ncbi:hypothetical protein RvY_16610-2 [Ramazzottius varieornatus]|uniref:Integrase SAM-like N-terminal domain-containing protein n=1 Tax=Ramazzottius varieornatus TaxID=947166 RepID=A0A1D1VZ33_RAMVA|nr:hypothetical protein RvY_16610-2 [Ramazzottius varieornatus]